MKETETRDIVDIFMSSNLHSIGNSCKVNNWVMHIEATGYDFDQVK